jgi:hypothetical protein
MSNQLTVSFYFDEDIYTSLVTVDVGDGDNLSFFVNLGNESLDHVLPFKKLEHHSNLLSEEENGMKPDLAFEMVLCISEAITRFLSSADIVKTG